MHDSNGSALLCGEYATLRPIEISDAELTYEWRHLERARMLGGAPDSLVRQQEWISTRPDSEINWIIERKSGSLPVGMVSLVDIDVANGRAQSARFLIGREGEVQGLPIAVESMLLVYRYAFETLGLHRIYGYVAASNRQMIKWQEFLGMKREGVWREHLCTQDSTYEDAVLLGLLVDEYEQTAKPKMLQMLKMAAAGKGK